MNNKFVVEVHTGKEYGVSRLNCDSAGQVKDVMINTTRYNRISSQSKKSVYRKLLNECFENKERAFRTRGMKKVFADKLKETNNPLYVDHAEEMAEAIVKIALQSEFKGNVSGVDITSQILVVTKYDVEDIAKTFCEVITNEEQWQEFKKISDPITKRDKNNKVKGIASDFVLKVQKTLKTRNSGIECSLFGRMSTADVMTNVDSAVSINHSFSFGKATQDSDYFTAVDNYLSEANDEVSEKSGAGYLDSKDFATHVYYEYASIDVGQFYVNLCKGNSNADNEEEHLRIKEIMKKAVRCLVNSIACAAPAGGQNSFASSPDPIGVYITIRDSGMNRTADTSCIREMNHKEKNKYGDYVDLREDEKFIRAMKNFVSDDFSRQDYYIKKMYIGDRAEEFEGIEHHNWKSALDQIEEIIDERF